MKLLRLRSNVDDPHEDGPYHVPTFPLSNSILPVSLPFSYTYICDKLSCSIDAMNFRGISSLRELNQFQFTYITSVRSIGNGTKKKKEATMRFQ